MLIRTIIIINRTGPISPHPMEGQIMEKEAAIGLHNNDDNYNNKFTQFLTIL